jgi:hypothetical protein
MIARTIWRSSAVFIVAAGAAVAYVATAPAHETPVASTFSIAQPGPVVACPGPQTVPVGDVGGDGDLASEPTQRELSVFAPVPTVTAGEAQFADAPVATQMERIGDGDIEGWSALTCGRPTFDQWLVGGSTSLGSSARLVLSNPSGAPTEATVTVFGPLGEIRDQLTIPVAPGATVDRLLEAVATELPAMVLRVEATGPGVVAALQDSRLEGFQPAGTEWVAHSDLADELVIPAVGAAEPNATMTLRLMSPEGASVSLSLVSEQGIEPWSVGRAFELEPGVVTDIDLPEGLAGAIEVRADGSVLAAARTVVPREPREAMTGDVSYDHMWVGGQAIEEGTLTAALPSTDARIALYSPTNTNVVITDADGDTVARATLRARTVQWIDVEAPEGTVLSTQGAFAWAFVMTSEDGYLTSSAPVRVSDVALSATVVPARYPDGN